jgi:cytochrome P450
MDDDERSTATVDYFDHQSVGFARHRYEWFRDIREQHGPVFWSPQYGGFWVVIGLAELTDAARNWSTFSSKCAGEIDGVRYDGVFLPPQEANARRMFQEDPPEWTVPRRTLNAMFSPEEVAKWIERIQTITDAAIDRVIETGRIDFVVDLFRPVSAVLSLEVAGLPTADFATIAETYGLAVHIAADDPRWEWLTANFEAETARIEAAIDHHETARGPGVITALLDARDEGLPITREDIGSVARLSVGAGLDTVAALLGSTFASLAKRPDLRQALAADPGLIDSSLDEFIRHGTPTQGLMRTCTKDTMLGGRNIRRGDRVMFCYGGADRDPREFEHPDDIRLGREVGRSVAFGSGIHKCLGIHFARLEFATVMRTALRRMPDFEVDLDHIEAYENVGIVAGWTSIPATFTPGERLDVDAGVPGWKY